MEITMSTGLTPIVLLKAMILDVFVLLLRKIKLDRISMGGVELRFVWCESERQIG